MVLLLVGGRMHGQSSLPAISPTSTPPAAAVPGEPAADPTAVKTPHAATVSYSDGQLAISADNSSLNQILREVSRQTGMKITGGVNDERVYGTYGPSGLAPVLTALLDGTGSNMMLTAGSAGGPGELILTPRQGGPTPPNPSAPGFDDDAATDERVQPPQPLRPFAPLVPPVAQQPQGAVRRRECCSGGKYSGDYATPGREYDDLRWKHAGVDERSEDPAADLPATTGVAAAETGAAAAE